jgi:vancomycin permeability regulator SanA
MAAWLERKGVPRAAIVIDPHGYRTAATMADAAAMGVRSALIATQPYHLPRSLYLARHAGIDAIGVPARNAGMRLDRWHDSLRELLARAEIVLEVALRGVRGG